MMRIVLLVVYVCSVHSMPSRKSLRASSQNGKIYDVVDLEVIVPHSQRHKRSVDIQQLPQSLNVKFTAKGDNFMLRLRRTADTSIPVYKFNNAYLSRHYVRSTQSAAVYEDVGTGSHVMVEKRFIRNKPLFTLTGHVVLNSNTFSIIPKAQQHVIRNVDSHIDFGKDEFHFWDDMAPILSIAQKKAEIDQIMNGKTSVDTFTIEMLFVADHTLRERFLKEYFASEVDSIVEKYFQLLLHSLQSGLDSISAYYPKVKVVVEKSGLIILDKASQAPFLTRNIRNKYLEMNSALDDFTDWLRGLTTAPKHDHGMWLTGMDLTNEGDESVVGVAVMGGLCALDKVSLIEDPYSGSTALIMIHELGHNLNADHDIEHESDGCSDKDMYIMASASDISIEKGKMGHHYMFSNCSATSIVHFLYKEENAKCTKVDNNGKTVPLQPQRAGQYFEADEQCRMSENNTESYFCRYKQKTASFDDMCVNLFCYDSFAGKCVGGNIAYEHTSCGDKKWCVRGRCVKDADAPSRQKKCPQFDDYSVYCDYHACSWYNAAKKAKCCDTCTNGWKYY